MFNYELANHEYCITLDVEETIQSIGLTLTEVRENENLRLGLKKPLRNKGIIKDSKVSIFIL